MQEIQGIHDSDLAESRWDFLVPWTALLVGHEIRVKTKCIGDDTYRFTFDAIYLNMQRNVMLDHGSHRALQTMAEAVHLVAAALALYPDAWTALLVDQCDCGFHFDPSIHDTSELAPRFEFDCSYYPGDILMAKTGLRFFQVLLDSTARTPQFHTAMQRLLLLPGVAASHRTLPPVPFRIDLSLWNEDQDILVGFMDFVRALKPFAEPNPADGRRPWSIVESIEIDWTGPGVCTDLVERTIAIVSHAPFVQITTATIDPKYVTCSSAELRQLLTTLTATYPRLKLRLGDVAPGTASGSILDGSIAESDFKVAMVMDSVASTQAQLGYLNIGHLMTTAGPLDRSRRQSVWNHLFGTLLGQKSACEIKMLALNSPRVMNVESDAHAIHLAATSFPNVKMPTRLTLGLTHAEQASIRAVISAFSASLQELRLYDRHQVIPSTTIAFILEMCPKLEYLDVDNAALDSMSLFYGVQVHCRLKRLVLNNIVLRDAASMPVFLTQLADPESCLGGSLSEFVLARYGHAATRQSTMVIGVTHVTLVEKILRFNGRVHTLQLDVDENAPTAFIDACNARHGTAAAVRLAPLSLPHKVAFLSVLDAKQKSPWANVSADVVGKIFEFAAECKPRWVHVKRTW